ncbi:hypothetical protein SDC9_123875 [bioreactor metagenome]|uniref:Uncharacterized protein n=1 Tax=bioreactor metagenome TaxID=1076179 RepID=A0A645CIU9_9ZZZZ
MQRLFRLDLDVGRGTAQAAGRLVHQDARMRQGETLAGSTRAQQELPHGRRQPHGHGRHVIADPLHGVVDRHARVDRAARGVDVQVDIFGWILGIEKEHLRADRVGVLVAYLGTEEDNTVRQQRLVDIIGHACTGSGRSRGLQCCHVWIHIHELTTPR